MIEDYEVFRIYVDRSADSVGLYHFEGQRNDVIKKCAIAWANLINKSEMKFPIQFSTDPATHEFWSKVMPTVLYDLLDSFDRRASYTACKAFIEQHKDLEGVKE